MPGGPHPAGQAEPQHPIGHAESSPPAARAEPRHPAGHAESSPPAARAEPRQLVSEADERHARFRQLQCDRCGAAVLVAKFSPQHTSVQWSAGSVRACAEFSARVAAGEQTALVQACASLRASIDRAVCQERLTVSPP